MQTREQELAELDTRIAEKREKLKNTTRPTLRERIERQIAGADGEARRLINQHHDRLDAQRAGQQAAARALEVEREAEQRQQLRRAWPGDDSSFDAAYPRLLEAYRTKIALDTAGQPPAGKLPRVAL